MKKKKITAVVFGLILIIVLGLIFILKPSDKSGGNLTVSTFGMSTKQMQRDVLNPFSKKTGVQVKTQFGDSANRLTQIEHDSHNGDDVIELSQNNALTANKKGLFKKINFNKITDFNKLSTNQQKLAKETNSIPYTVNSVGIIYNPKKVKINDWNDLWSSKLRNKIAIPDITTTFGPAMLYIASDHEKKSIIQDDGQAAFKGISDLKPNVVKTYAQSSDLANMFKTGEIDAAVVGDYAVGMIKKADPNVQYLVPKSGTYANYDTVSILKNSKNINNSYKYINYRLNKNVQKRVAAVNSLNNAPVNKNVKLSKVDAKDKTYGVVTKRAKMVNFNFVNQHLTKWISEWNKIMNK